MRTTAITMLAAAALALAACGGSGEDTSTRDEFIATIDARCKVSNARTKRLNEAAARVAATARGDQQLMSALALILARGYGVVRDNAAAFEAVDPPPEDAAEVERIRKLYDEQAELARRLEEAAQRGHVEAFKAATEEQKDLVQRVRKATSAYGFKECGSTKSDAA